MLINADVDSAKMEDEIAKIESDYIIDEYIVDHVEILEYLHSSQGKRDTKALDRDFGIVDQELEIPNFSLGIEDQTNLVLEVFKDINKEHGEDDFVTPAPQREKRPNKKAKLAPAYLSPYVQRHIYINAKYSTQEYAAWRWIIQPVKDAL